MSISYSISVLANCKIIPLENVLNGHCCCTFAHGQLEKAYADGNDEDIYEVSYLDDLVSVNNAVWKMRQLGVTVPISVNECIEYDDDRADDYDTIAWYMLNDDDRKIKHRCLCEGTLERTLAKYPAAIIRG